MGDGQSYFGSNGPGVVPKCSRATALAQKPWCRETADMFKHAWKSFRAGAQSSPRSLHNCELTVCGLCFLHQCCGNILMATYFFAIFGHQSLEVQIVLISDGLDMLGTCTLRCGTASHSCTLSHFSSFGWFSDGIRGRSLVHATDFVRRRL